MERPIWHTAAEFAARKHDGQRRKDRVTPYFSHPCRVALTVAAVFGFEDDERLAAALLHDTLEDTLTDYDDLAEAFGPAVTEMVAALTDNKALPGAASARRPHAAAASRAGPTPGSRRTPRRQVSSTTRDRMRPEHAREDPVSTRPHASSSPAHPWAENEAAHRPPEAQPRECASRRYE
ncbi:MAG: HD domain-containing protein [Phycisphaerales bacterium]|jgi:hypothetical protein|nr:HD domain-containing protein [Phycisphaerales bacterium]